MEGATIPLGPASSTSRMLEPIGVTAHIVPWNYPLGMATRSLAPALAAGCTAVLKPAEQSPLTALKLRRDLPPRPAFPPGVLNVVTGFGEEAGDALVAPSAGPRRHLHRLGRDRARASWPRPRAGRSRSCSSSAARTRCSSSPMPISTGWSRTWPTAPSAIPARSARPARGSWCSRTIADELVERLARARRSITVGPGRDDPRHRPARLRRAARQGHRPSSRRRSAPARGSLPAAAARRISPAATSSRRPSSPTSIRALRIVREEVFGPVLTVTPLRRRGRGARARQRPRLRPRRRRLHPRHLARAEARAAARGRLGLDQRLVHRRPAGADRRHQGQRHRPRARPARHPQLPSIKNVGIRL